MNLERIVNIYQKYTPDAIKGFVGSSIIMPRRCKNIINYYSDPENLKIYSEEEKNKILAIVNILKEQGYVDICLPDKKIKRKYSERKIPVFKNPENGLFYIELDEKRMYFKREMNKNQILKYFNNLSAEQDLSSPHRYFSSDRYFYGGIPDNRKNINSFKENSFGVNEGDVVFDVGGCEGNFALSVADIAKKIYIFECNAGWYEALCATFKPYGSKVEIINKYISGKDDEFNVTIDGFLKSRNETVNFIKLDIEGFEEDALNSATETIRTSENIRIAVCTYHRSQDEKHFYNMFKELNFNVEFTKGYMLSNVYDNNPDHPWLFRGVLRAGKVN